jgi:integrase
MAEGVGFEPTDSFPSSVFKTDEPLEIYRIFRRWGRNGDRLGFYCLLLSATNFTVAAKKKITITPSKSGFVCRVGEASRTFSSSILAEAWGKVQTAPDYRHCRLQFNAEERRPFIVAYPSLSIDGRRTSNRRKFSDFGSATAFAQEREIASENHGRQFATELTRDEIAAVSGWRVESARLVGMGVAVPDLAEIIREGVARLSESPDGRTINEQLVQEFIEHKKDRRIGSRQQIDYASRLGRFRVAFEGRALASIATTELDQWLTSLRQRTVTKSGPHESDKPVSPQTRKHYRAALSAFFAWATPNRNPAAQIQSPLVQDPDRDHYKPEEAKKLLDWILVNDPGILPPVVLGLFCGVRTAERARVDLSAIDLSNPSRLGEFILRGKTRGGRSRAIPLPPAAKAWLLTQDRREGPVITTGLRVFHSRLANAHEKSEVRKIKNGFRHSFASYRGAILRNSDQLKDEMGNSAAIVARHYRDARLQAEAKEFFAIRPDTARD